MENEGSDDKEKEVRAFDETKSGVKGLVDAGVLRIPPIFVLQESDRLYDDHLVIAPPRHDLQIPVIDMMMRNREDGRLIDRKRIVEEVRSASGTWGFFQVVNHGVAKELMDEMIEGVRRFHELPNEEKIGYYSRDNKRKVKFNSNFYLYNSKSVCWRDTLYFNMAPDAPEQEEFPPVCRDIGIKYTEQVMDMAFAILQLLSEALGLEPNHLVDIGCAEGITILSHYYPACPEPTRTQGANPHKDSSFITILMQDHIGGLQTRHQDQWINVPPVPGAFVINVGDLLQLISNDIFKSSVHRVLANKTGPRISVALFLSTQPDRSDRLLGPIKELLSDENPPLYKDIQLLEYALQLSSKGMYSATTILDHFRL